MLVPTLVMGALAIIIFIIGYQKGVHVQGLKITGNMLVQMLPLLFFAFVVAGMLQTLIPHEIVSRWIGVESGFRGILIGTVIGGLMPGGPMTSLPIAAGLLRMGASVGTMVALITGWSLLAFARLPLDIGILGWEFALIRLACTFFFPPVAGLVANMFFSRVNLT